MPSKGSNKYSPSKTNKVGYFFSGLEAYEGGVTTVKVRFPNFFDWMVSGVR